jgi:hypothetical protein
MPAHPLASSLARCIDGTLALQLFAEAVDVEESFALKRWKYTELDGGRFAEVAARIIYSVDAQNVSLTRGVDECLKYIDNQSVSHAFPEKQSAVHLSKVIRSIYKLRSQRGAVHVSPTYSANEIDSRLVVESVRWILAEILRIFVTTDREVLASVVQELARFPQPLIRNYGGQPLLQSISFTTEEEVLIHLLHERQGMTMPQLVQVIPKDSTGVRKAVKRLAEAKVRQVVASGSIWEITDLGVTRAEDRILKENSAR